MSSPIFSLVKTENAIVIKINSRTINSQVANSLIATGMCVFGIVSINFINFIMLPSMEFEREGVGVMPDWMFMGALIPFLFYILIILITLFWPTIGWEKIVIKKDVMQYSFGYGTISIRKYNLALSLLSNARLATQAHNDQWRQNLWSGPPEIFKRDRLGMIVIDSDEEAFSFGVSLTVAEATIIKNIINEAL